MADLQGRVRERLREHLVRQGASASFSDPALFDDVERLLQTAVDVSPSQGLVLQELLGDPSTWRLETAMTYRSHRGVTDGFIVFVKRRLLMPMLRWLFEYSRDNFERQRRVNRVLFACVQELAIENAKLRQDVRRLS